MNRPGFVNVQWVRCAQVTLACLLLLVPSTSEARRLSRRSTNPLPSPSPSAAPSPGAPQDVNTPLPDVAVTPIVTPSPKPSPSLIQPITDPASAVDEPLPAVDVETSQERVQAPEVSRRATSRTGVSAGVLIPSRQVANVMPPSASATAIASPATPTTSSTSSLASSATASSKHGSSGFSSIMKNIVAALGSPPTVDAGSDQTITLPNNATLRGSAQDDGKPNPPGKLTATWSLVNGPGTVSFSPPDALTTTATCSQPGTYVLQLTVTDGVYTSNDTVTVTVASPPAPPITNTGSTIRTIPKPKQPEPPPPVITPNVNPLINFIRPTPDAIITESSRVELRATAIDPDGTVRAVEFFDGDVSVAKTTAPVDGQLAFEATWTQASVGRHMLSAVVTDDRGATTRSGVTPVIVVPAQPPSGTVLINQGAASTTSHEVMLTLTTTARADLPVYVALANDVANEQTVWTMSELTPAKPWNLSTGNSLKTVFAKFSYDRARWSTPPALDLIELTPPSPTMKIPSGTLHINSGDPATNTVRVRLSFRVDAASPPPTLVAVCNLVTPTACREWREWVGGTLLQLNAWDLDGTGDGLKTVVAKVCASACDEERQWSEPTSARILLDRTPPTTPRVTDGGAQTTSTTTLEATWMNTSADFESWITEYQYRLLLGSPTGPVLIDWTSTAVTPSVSLTNLRLSTGFSYYFAVRAKNGAGSWSEIGTSDGMLVVKEPPRGLGSSFTINGGSSRYTASSTVSLHLQLTGNDETLLRIRFANAPSSAPDEWKQHQAYDVPAGLRTYVHPSWRLTEGKGSKTVYAHVEDTDGRPLVTWAASIQVDITPPTLQVTSVRDGMKVWGLWFDPAAVQPPSASCQAGQRLVLEQPSFAVEGTVTDEAIESVTVNGQKAELNDTAFRAAVTLAEGSNPLTIVATDQAKNSTSTSISVIVRRGAPTCPAAPTLAPLPEVSPASTVTLEGTKPPKTSVWFSVGGASSRELVPPSEAITWKVSVELPEGDVTFSLTARNDDELDSPSITRSILIDALPPAIAVEPLPKAINLDVVNLRGSVDDRLTTVAMTVNAKQTTTSQTVPVTRTARAFTATVPLIKGLNEIQITATSPTSRISKATHTILRGTLPEITWKGPPDRRVVYVGASIPITTSVVDQDGDPVHCRLVLDQQPLVAWSACQPSSTWVPTETQVGRRTLVVQAKDDYGGESSKSIEVFVVHPPVAPSER